MSEQIERWMILGGGGPFGVHLAKYLLLSGRNVEVIAVGRDRKLDRAYSLGLSDDPRWIYEQVNIVADFWRLTQIFEQYRPAFVINFAALAYANSWEQSHLYYQTNVAAVAAITEHLTGKRWLQHFVQVSTSELYGSNNTPVDENAPLRPTSPYAASKLAADVHLTTLKKGFPWVIIRPSNCYGEGQQLYRVVPRAAWCAVAGQKMPLEGGGHVEKSYMHALDLASAIVRIVDKNVWCQVLNAGPPQSISIRNIVKLVAMRAGLFFGDFVEEAPGRPIEDACYRLNSSRMHALGWAPLIEYGDGIDRVLDWTRQHIATLDAPRPFVLRS